ncbi:CDP-glucose 4,6-dehydratase [Lachnospiraceae bacterium KHCPX20]|nr:CDP-glucose 4,6-dehydratase [Lachnospiraceae bacterium KHCPX20]
MIKREFWKNKRVLITGHTGFVGTWLLLTLCYFGADVIGLSLEAEEGCLYEKVKNGFQHRNYSIDLLDRERVADCINEGMPEIVFHLAAYGFVKECYENPDEAWKTNVIGTQNLLQVLKGCETVKSIVVASSDKVYLNKGEHHLFIEEDPLGGVDTYSASKTCEDILVQSFFYNYLSKNEVGMTVLRPSNILGPGDHHDNRLIPSIFLDCLNGREPKLRNPASVRPWQNIMDAIDAYLITAEKSYYQSGIEIYNIGPEPVSIRSTLEMAEYVRQRFQMSGNLACDSGEDEIAKGVKEHAYLGLDITKIKEETDWFPRRSVEDTLDEIYDYIVKSKIESASFLCVNLIRDFYAEI